MSNSITVSDRSKSKGKVFWFKESKNRWFEKSGFHCPGPTVFKLWWLSHGKFSKIIPFETIFFLQFRKYSLRRILNVEENHDEKRGDRYLVELELEEITSGKSARFSEYVYKQRGVDTLCTPEGMTWNKSAVINILLTTGNNQGRWILHFLENMARIYSETKDSKVNVIIVDFDSKDLDIEKALKQAAIPNYQYANKNDKFSRASGLQRAAEMVKEPNSIVFAMDLHLDIPYHFLDDVRKVSVLSNLNVYTGWTNKACLSLNTLPSSENVACVACAGGK